MNFTSSNSFFLTALLCFLSCRYCVRPRVGDASSNLTPDDENPHLKDALARITKTFHEMGLPMMLYAGTAIGFRRSGEQNLVDADVDTAVTDKDLQQLGSTFEEQQTAVLEAAKANDLTPWSHESGPYAHHVGNEVLSILYSFVHVGENGRIRVDVFVLHEDDDGHLWDFAEGGEYSGTGKKYPLAQPIDFELPNDVHVPGAEGGQTVRAAPESWLVYLYGDWRVPHLHYEGYNGPDREKAFDTDANHLLPLRGYHPQRNG